MSSAHQTPSFLESGLFKELNKLGRQPNSSSTPNLAKATLIPPPPISISPAPAIPADTVPQDLFAIWDSPTATTEQSGWPAQEYPQTSASASGTFTNDQESPMPDWPLGHNTVGGMLSLAHSDGSAPPQVFFPWYFLNERI